MTQQRDFKKLVRERMTKTGERYAAARAHLLTAQSNAEEAQRPISGLFHGYRHFGGICGDTGALRNTLVASGLIAPHTKKHPTEALVTGLCGGVGILYAVFEYKGFPPFLTMVYRYDSMADTFIKTGVSRLGLSATISETGSAVTARKALDAAIDKRRPALCVVDQMSLYPDQAVVGMTGMMPTVVAVAGFDADMLLIDDGGAEPLRISQADFSKARSAYKKAKNRLITFGDEMKSPDWAPILRQSIHATAERYDNAPFKGFASNFGFAGLSKWRRLLTDGKDKKGWPTLFPDGAAAYMGLRRAYDGIDHEYTPPAAGRPLYAEFLKEAAAVTGEQKYSAAAEMFAMSGKKWGEIADTIAHCGDKAVEQGCKNGDSARELLDSCDRIPANKKSQQSKDHAELRDSCKLTASGAAAIYATIADLLSGIENDERDAVKVLLSVSIKK